MNPYKTLTLKKSAGAIAMKEREKALFQEMLAVLKDYRFEFDRQRTQVMTVQTGMGGFTVMSSRGW